MATNNDVVNITRIAIQAAAKRMLSQLALVLPRRSDLRLPNECRLRGISNAGQLLHGPYRRQLHRRGSRPVDHELSLLLCNTMHGIAYACTYNTTARWAKVQRSRSHCGCRGDANQTGSPDTIMVIIMSVGGAVAFFLCCFMCIFFVNRSRRDEDSEADSTEDMNTSRRRKKGGSGDADDRSDTSDLSDEFYDDDATKTTAKSSWAEDRKKRRQRRKKDNGKKGKGWSLSNIMPDMELCT
eukprot:CAMPEP_0178694302 /NCGR_PEP_ID=MMETSP0699-20121125/8176_1 /TAXON_ID=265572 /ORGANISM="Extubocellulus spinifer, Strain CCMP396" /LENGTH=239 /DNA_ID=CAMNT_0020339777 /DNA_START=253 /DNA_END=972 /DNA_ORIENTATION=-